MSHTKTPWIVEEYQGKWFVTKNGTAIASELTEEDARRIVACVNACEGIKTIDLESMRGTSILTKANENCDTTLKQRDQLLAALKAIADPESVPSYGDPSVLRDYARAAIAAVEVGV